MSANAPSCDLALSSVGRRPHLVIVIFLVIFLEVFLGVKVALIAEFLGLLMVWPIVSTEM